jgi:hypothetical protein
MTLILSGTNGLSDVDGDASTPAIRGSDSNTGIFFGTDIIGFSEGGTECGRFNASGNLQTIGTISVGNATPSTSGAGITFPATQSASSNANTLDDYEEGTFTPVAGTGVTTNSGTPAYSGSYTKIGRLVYITTRQTAGNITVSSGGQVFTGLPFTPNIELQACSITNGDPNISGTGMIYLGGGGGEIYAGFAAASQTSYVVTAVYSV